MTLLYLRDNEAFAIETGKDSGDNEFRVLMTNSTPVDIVYTKRVTDVTRWDTLLTNCVSHRLSAELAQALHGESSMVDRMWNLYEEMYKQATLVDSRQSWTRNRIAPSSHLRARLAGRRSGAYSELPGLDVTAQPL